MIKPEKIADELFQRRWAVDCPEMKLVQLGGFGSTRYIGPGSLQQQSDGIVTYKLYPPSPPGVDLLAIPKMTGLAGRLLEDDEFYQLGACPRN